MEDVEKERDAARQERDDIEAKLQKDLKETQEAVSEREREVNPSYISIAV